ncbi:hypothetical protein VKT23_013778 [Stygiomarasmius scandens]|uniref:Uncharacterized protein n=1 Tax=Marasmiellus scandens TaxID=2682957 RepID=A0ABR1J334_9AGAR
MTVLFVVTTGFYGDLLVLKCYKIWLLAKIPRMAVFSGAALPSPLTLVVYGCDVSAKNGGFTRDVLA